MFAPADRARVAVDRAGELAAVCERGRISIVALRGERAGDAIAALDCDERARAVEVGWAYDELFVLTQQRDHALVQRFSPAAGELTGELAFDVRVRLGAVAGDTAVVLGEGGAGLVHGARLASTQLPLDVRVVAAAPAGDGFVLAGGVIVEQWSLDPARVRAMRCPAELAFVGGTDDAVWAIAREDRRLFELARWGGGDAPWLELPEPIRWAHGDPRAPVVVCGGAERVYVVRWDEAALRADVLDERVDAAAIVTADPLHVLELRATEPLAIFDDEDLAPLDAPTGATARSPRPEWRDEVLAMAPFAPHTGATPGRWGIAALARRASGP